MEKVEILKEWGFKGRGGKEFRVLETLVGGWEALLAELKKSKPEASGFGFFQGNMEVPQVINPGVYEAGYRLLDDPIYAGGSGEGEYYFHQME